MVEVSFWACHYSIILLDLSNPMIAYEKLIPINDILNDIDNTDCGDINLGNINFKS